MKKKITMLGIVLIFLAGVGLMLYPTLANDWNESIYRHTIVNYEQEVTSLDTDITDELVQKAIEYNERHAEQGNFFGKLTEEQRDAYNKQLSQKGDDVSNMLGYLEMPDYEIELPIYRGTSNEVLSAGVGHLEGTSLPVGGTSSHCVLSGHTGLYSAKLLSDLDKVKIGDKFYIKVLGETLIYEVDQILVVRPDNLSDLQIIEGMDLCTLVTCTPYGTNTHRLLVRGHRVDEEKELLSNVGWKKEIFSDKREIIVIAFAIVLIAILVLIFLTKRKKTDTE